MENFFRHASVSSTYPGPAVRRFVIFSDFHSVIVVDGIAVADMVDDMVADKVADMVADKKEVESGRHGVGYGGRHGGRQGGRHGG